MKRDVVSQDLPQGLISQAVYEWTQTLWEDDETNKEGVLDMTGHNRVDVPYAIVIYHVKQSGYETQAELDQVQQHCLACFTGTTGTRRGRLDNQQDREICVDDSYADYYKVGNSKGIAYGGKNGHVEKIGPAAEMRHSEARVLQADKQDNMGEGVQRPSGPYERHGHPRRPGCDNVNMLQRAANGNVPLQRHHGEVEWRHL